jgi:preprotein translocase subunit SecB
MTEQQQTEQQSIQFEIKAQYVKGLAVNNPNSPQIFAKNQGEQPNLNVKVDVNARKVGDDAYESILSLQAQATVGEDILFTVELAYAGVFSITNAMKEQLQPILLIECPRLLFPYAREIISNATTNAGFAPLLIQPIDFVQLYRKQIEAAQQQAAANGEQGEGSQDPQAINEDGASENSEDDTGGRIFRKKKSKIES